MLRDQRQKETALLTVPLELLCDLSFPLNREPTTEKHLHLISSTSDVVHGGPSTTPGSRLDPNGIPRSYLERQINLASLFEKTKIAEHNKIG